MDWPSLSVIIPSYNQGRYIERTLLSVLRQGYPGPLEVIVSDGGSTDGTVGVLGRYPQVRWWSERDRGFVDAVAKGLAAATGEVVALQSSDDYYLEGAFARAIPVLQERKDLAFVTGSDVLIEEDGRVTYLAPKPYVTLLNPGGLIGRSTSMYVPQHCTFIRRSALDGVRGLREEVDYCADFDLWYRLLHFGRAVVLPDYLAAYQKHSAQRTQSRADFFIRLHKKVVEDAEANPLYAGRFLPTPEMKRRIFLQWEIGWNRAAGGDEGFRESIAMAQEALGQADPWPDYMLDFLTAHSKGPSELVPIEPPAPKVPEPPASGMLQRLKRSPGIRALLGKSPLPVETPALEEPAPIKAMPDLDWWRDKAQAPAAALTALIALIPVGVFC